jgi:uncharacterized protein (TIGR00251 family)
MELRIRVRPEASRNAVEVGDAGQVTVRVTAAPERGKANKAFVALLAKKLGVTKSSVTLVRGLTSRDKVVRIDGVTEGEVRGLLAAE